MRSVLTVIISSSSSSSSSPSSSVSESLNDVGPENSVEVSAEETPHPVNGFVTGKRSVDNGTSVVESKRVNAPASEGSDHKRPPVRSNQYPPTVTVNKPNSA